MVEKNFFSQTFIKLLSICLLVGVCRSAVYNAPCLASSECQMMYTSKYECEDNRCIREKLAWSFLETSGYIMIFFLTVITNAAGIGGGPIIVPVFIYMFNFASIESIPLSKITILVGALANFLLTYKDRFPNQPRYLLIDLSAGASITPLMLSGTQVGVLLQKLLPPAAVMTSLTLLVVFTLIRLYRSGVTAFNKESMEIERLEQIETELVLKDEEIPKDIESIPLGEEAVTSALLEQGKIISTDHPSLCSLYQPHLINLLILCTSILIIILTALFRGGEASSSWLGIDRCSKKSGWILAISQLMNCVLAWTCFKYNEARGLFNPEFSKVSDKAYEVIAYSYGVGIAAGLFGLGGGMVLGPYLISIGLHPEFSAALTGFTLIWVASSTSIQYSIVGALHFKHAAPFMMISSLGSLVGNNILRGLIRKYKRPSILIWMIFLIMVIAGIVIPFEVAKQIIRNPKYALSFGFYC